MKNQLRKATLRAAALTMSATIVATSVPMTAFAEEGNDGQKDDGSQQVSTAKSAEAQVSDKESTTSDDIATANKEVGDIKPAAQAAGIATGEGTDVDMAETNVAKAVENEKTVAADVKTIVDSKEAEDGINASEYAIEELISKKKDIVEKENKNQEKINKEIVAAEEAIKNKANKDEADSIVEDANKKITSGNESYTEAANGIAELDKDYEKEMSNLEAKQKKYSEAVSKGVKDIEKVEGDIANAKTNVTDLQNQVTNLTTEVDNMSTEVKKTAVEELADKYYDAKRTPEGTKELFETIVKSYQEDILGEGVTVIEIGSYNDEYNAYEVTYKKGDKEETAYLSYVTNDNDNGITVSKIEKEVVEEGKEAFWDNEQIIIKDSDYRDRVNSGDIKEAYGKAFYVKNAQYEELITEGTTTKQDGDKLITTTVSINNPTTVVISAGGAVKVTGEVETVVKTETPLSVTSSVLYNSKEEAERAAIEAMKNYSGDQYKDVDYVVDKGWSASAAFIKTKEEHENKEKSGLYGGYNITVPFVGVVGIPDNKYAISSECVKRNDYKITYADVEIVQKPYTTWQNIKDSWNEFWGGEATDRIKLEDSVKAELEVDNGFVVRFISDNLDFNTADLYIVKGTKATAFGVSEADAKANLEKEIKAKTSSYTGYRFEGTTQETPYYTFKIVGTKITTESDEPTIKDIKVGKADSLSYHEAIPPVIKYTSKEYDNSFLDTAKNDKTKRLEEEEKLSNDKTAKQKTLGELNTQLTEASKALEKAKTDSAELKKQVDALNTTASTVGANIKLLKENYTNLKLDSNGTEGRKQKIEDAYNKLPNRPSNNGGSNNGGGSNNNNNQPAAPVLPVGPAATTTTTTQQVVTLVDDQTPLSATADDTVAPKTNKKAAKKNAAKTTDSDSKKTNKNNAKKQPKKVTPEVEDDTIDEDLEIVSLDDEDKVPLAPGVASNDSTKDIMDETSSVSWLWLIILAVASVVTFGTYKGVKKHNENKGKNNR